MAIYKQDIVNINLESGSIFRSFLNKSIGHKDDDADRFGVRVFRDGEAVDLSGLSCQAVFMAPNGVNIALTSYGTVSGNVAYVTLPPACYDYEGQFCLAIKLVGGGVTSTVRIVDGMVERTGTSGAVTPTGAVPTYQEILSVYDDMVAATAAANLALAEEFDATKAYPSGKLLINDGNLYRLTADHAAGTTWANTSKVSTNFGDEVSGLKSALAHNIDILDYKLGNVDFVYNSVDISIAYTGGVQGTVGSAINITSTASYKYVIITPVEEKEIYIFTIPQTTSGNYPYYVYATDDNGIILDRFAPVPGTAGTNEYWVIAPVGCKKFYFMYKSSETTQAAKIIKYSDLQGQIDGKSDENMVTLVRDYIAENFDNYDFPIDTSIQTSQTGGLQGELGGSINVTSSSSYKYVNFTVESGDLVRISIPQTTSNSYPYYIFGLDSLDKIIMQDAPMKAVAGVYSYIIPVLDDIKKMYVMYKAGETSQNIAITKYTKQASLEALRDGIADTGMATVIEHNLNRRCLNFSFITDTHANGYENAVCRASKNIELYKRVSNTEMLDFACHGGDVISAYGTSRNDYLKEYIKYFKDYNGFTVPLYFAKGNHENNAEEGYSAEMALSMSQYYMIAQQRNYGKVVVNPEAPYDGYYYVDIDDIKIRLIVLNMFRDPTGGTSMNVGTKQTNWFYNTALNFQSKETPTDWNVLVVSHFHYSDTNDITKIMQAFNDKGTTYGSYTFASGTGGYLIAHIHGHAHADLYSNEYGYNQIGVRRGFANIIRYNTEEEYCFDVFTVDTVEKKLYETRFGTGDSREYTWGEVSDIVTE